MDRSPRSLGPFWGPPGPPQGPKIKPKVWLKIWGPGAAYPNLNADWLVRSVRKSIRTPKVPVRNQDDFQKCYKNPCKNLDDSKSAIKTKGKSPRSPKYKDKYNFRPRCRATLLNGSRETTSLTSMSLRQIAQQAGESHKSSSRARNV